MKITFTSFCHTSESDLARNKRYAESLGFPRLGEAESPHLAVVGGGASAVDHVNTLKNWDGEIWAINRAWQWCDANGIDATFCTAEARPVAADIVSGVKRAMLSMTCSVELFDALIAEGAHIDAVSLGLEGSAGPTTATAFLLSTLDKGHSKITFFGCESSWDETSHIYEDKSCDGIMRVVCNGKTFLTQPYLMMQAEVLAAVIRAAPGTYSEMSGGLLRATTVDAAIDVIAATPDIHKSIEQAEAIA